MRQDVTKKKSIGNSQTSKGMISKGYQSFQQALSTDIRAENKRKSFKQTLRNNYIKIKDPRMQEIVEK